MNPHLRKLNNLLAKVNNRKLSREAYNYFVDYTPYDTGYAKKNTQLVGNKIIVKYQYADVLDEGRGFRDGQMRGSNQSPYGMSRPTYKYISKLAKRWGLI